MKTKGIDTQHKHTGRCGIVFRNGSFREYATEMLEKGKGDGSVFRVQNRLVYVCTHPYHERRLIKVVIEPNYKSHGIVMNIVKSWGVVEQTKMNGPQYRQVK